MIDVFSKASCKIDIADLSILVETRVWSRQDPGIRPTVHVYGLAALVHTSPASVTRRDAAFSKGMDVLPQDLVKSQSREMRVETLSIALKFDRHIDSSATEMSVKFQNGTIMITPD